MPSRRLTNVCPVREAHHLFTCRQPCPTGKFFFCPLWWPDCKLAICFALCPLPRVTAVGTPLRCLEWRPVVVGIRVILAFLRSRRSVYPARLPSGGAAHVAGESPPSATLGAASSHRPILAVCLSVWVERRCACHNGLLFAGFPGVSRSHCAAYISGERLGIFSIFLSAGVLYLPLLTYPVPQ